MSRDAGGKIVLGRDTAQLETREVEVGVHLGAKG